MLTARVVNMYKRDDVTGVPRAFPQSVQHLVPQEDCRVRARARGLLLTVCVWGSRQLCRSRTQFLSIQSGKFLTTCFRMPTNPKLPLIPHFKRTDTSSALTRIQPTAPVHNLASLRLSLSMA